MDILLQVAVGFAFVLLALDKILAYAVKLNKKNGADKPMMVTLVPGTEVVLARQCSERLLQTMKNSEVTLVELRDWREDRQAAKQRSEAMLGVMQEMTRQLSTMHLMLTAHGAQHKG